jgi:hypothetical protein
VTIFVTVQGQHPPTVRFFTAPPVTGAAQQQAHHVEFVEGSVTSFIHSSHDSKSSLQRSSWKVWGLNLQTETQRNATAECGGKRGVWVTVYVMGGHAA